MAGLDRGLTEKDGFFKSAARLQESDPDLGVTLAIVAGTVIQFYTVAAADAGSGLPIDDSTLFANPVDAAGIITNAEDIITNAAAIEVNETAIEANATAIALVEWEFKTGGGLLEENHKYIFGDSLGYTMPVMADASKFVGLSAHGGNTPTMTVNNVTAAEHFIKAKDLVDNGDTTFQIDADDNGKEYTAISNATDWEM